MKPDPVIAEVRATRHKISAAHGHSSRRLIKHYIQLQEKAKKSGKYQFVTGFYSTADNPAKTSR